MALEIHLSQGSGKACKGCAKTGTIQVVDDWGRGNRIILKQFRYTNGDEESLRNAYRKAHEYVKSHR